MRPDSIGKQNLIRAQASLVALLYVLLCTFGTLTHTHAWSETEHAERNTTGSPASSHAPHPKSRHLCDSTVAPIQVCAFCDWQANSVSPALASLQVLPPQRFALAPLTAPVLSEATHNVRGTSRAPPVA